MLLCHIIVALNMIECVVFGVKIQVLGADHYGAFDNRVEIVGAIADTKIRSLLDCQTHCSRNDRCLTFFYNHDYSKRCVMHSKDFIFCTPSIIWNGWKYYVTKDISGRCPTSMYYHRNLNFCYTVDSISSIYFAVIKAAFSSIESTLATITTQEMQRYFTYLLSERHNERVCLNGEVESMDRIVLKDGNILSYYNLAQNEPDFLSTEKCFVMFREDKWHNLQCIRTIFECTFVSELK